MVNLWKTYKHDEANHRWLTKSPLILVSLLLVACSPDDDELIEPVYPIYGPEISVIIENLSFDAMEPFLSPDGSTLFFNNLNDGINTKLYYATKINDAQFAYVGELSGANQITTPHLDAVADLDSEGNFYWTSTRNYPAELNNLFHGILNDGEVSDIGRVEGDFYMNIPGWLIMDHGVSLDGQFLYISNARFDNTTCIGPCETTLSIAQKNGANSFVTLANSEALLANINDTNYIYYAPCISSDNLELYYTRYLKGAIEPTTIFEICVAVRNKADDIFELPKVLFSAPISSLVEAPTLTVDKRIMYYHRKTDGTHKIFMRERQ